MDKNICEKLLTSNETKIKDILGISDHSYNTWFANMKIAYM